MATQHLIFSGPIAAASAANLTAAILEAYRDDTISELVIALASVGGSVPDGIALYSLLRAAPKPVRMHAIGNVESIAITVFLGAEKRVAVPDTLLLFHPMTSSFANAVFTRRSLRDVAEKLEADERRLQALWCERTTLTEEEAADLFERDRMVNADWARQHGFVHAVDALVISPGARIKQIQS